MTSFFNYQKMPLVLLLCCIGISIQCSFKSPANTTADSSSATTTPQVQPVVLGIQQLDHVMPALRDKRVALVVNHTAVLGKVHLVDMLLSMQVNVQKIFAPEHGFRGDAPDGERIKDGVDPKTNVRVVSLYGNNYKPTPEQLADVDVLIFDIQDVGARFYTYISTMHYVMEACAENNKKLIILDRPNPNAGYVDGPVLDLQFKSFVGMHRIPIVHGLTVGELATMINGEGWLAGGRTCDLEIVKLKFWTHADSYSLPVRPSPNLPNDQAIRLYPSLCLFEGTVISVGRGTEIPFTIIGNPELKQFEFQFKPVSIPGMSTKPPHENTVCYGLDLRQVPVGAKLDLKYLLQMYEAYPYKEKFFNASFNRLAGNSALQQQIKEGLSEEAIRKSWQQDLEAYKAIREKYLLYP
jgi:uncharacterized protein YbbC (DUF1343 family)